jgi:SAM-dependent methyltransferase
MLWRVSVFSGILCRHHFGLWRVRCGVVAETIGRCGTLVQLRWSCSVLREEAELSGRWLEELNLPAGSVCLNIGSSTRQFRSITQPHIDALLFRPLASAGIKIVHCDLKANEGVDEVGDLLDPAFQQRLKGYDADLLICSNLLEHLTDAPAFAAACAGLVRPGGFGLFTVPYRYPYHPDPIDTLFRPTPEELIALLPDWEVVRAERLRCGNYLADLRTKPQSMRVLAKQVARSMLPFYNPDGWLQAAHRLTFLVRPYRQSMLLARKPRDV